MPAIKKAKRQSDIQFDEAEFGSYRKTLHIVMDRPGFEESAETPVVSTACGRKFAASLFHKHND